MLNFPGRIIGPADLRRMLDDGGEIALLDVREEGVYARDGHILLASNTPLSHLEMRVRALLPRKPVRVVVCDDNDGHGAIAASRLDEAGYSNVMLLDGGSKGWAAAGFPLYTGVHVCSKAFGEYVHHHDRTPEVTATELIAWKNAARDVLILDSRPADEYLLRSIPGAIDCPGAELCYRVPGLLHSPQSVVVVNCGGRTRSIIGAQALINAGLENKVVALKDGTQGWHLAGFKLDHGRTEHASLPSAAGLALAKKAATRIAGRFGVRTIDNGKLRDLQSDRNRTLYLLDVRSPEEFESGHLAEAVSAPGGQLVQATDTFLGVQHGTVVLVDGDGVRATVTASWLIQMGWDNVFVLEQALDAGELEQGPRAPSVLGWDKVSRASIVSAIELSRLLEQGKAQVADLDSSLRYCDGHIPGAWHVVRSRLRENLEVIPNADMLVFTSGDGILARFAAADAGNITAMPIRVLEGGMAAWRACGFSLEAGATRLTGATDDVRYRALDRQSNVNAAICEYLKWETDLVNAVGIDPDFRFRRFP